MAAQMKNVVVVGATGNLGSVIIQALVETNNFYITAASRIPPKFGFPNSPSLTIKTGDYDSPSFLAEVFTKHDAVVFALHYTAVPELEIKMIEAAAQAGVKWIPPSNSAAITGIQDWKKLCRCLRRREHRERESKNWRRGMRC